jgi:hypothetical protein
VRGQELSHPLSASQRTYPRKILAQDTVHVLAVMVQFQADNDSLTSGNGRFMLGEGSGLDAPPHNKSYFQNHLLFLKNYFRKVSGGNLNVAYTVLDSVVTLPHQMKYYSPPKSGGGNNMGLLFQDSWRIADSLYGGTFPFSQYQCFVIFHAGSGRDIDFTSVLGYDPLPYDIPSIYLSRQSLENMFGANYPGQVVENGRDAITNSIIMPESESYPILPLTLGTNGLLAASFGSFLGLPDLFDTQTGATGIGKFGLMDGQAIFAYGGIFPPEPSAWEKTYLGWVTPVEISPSTTTQYALYANETGKYSVLKVPISATEYFLLENRECDAHHDGEIVTSIYNDAVNTTEITFANDTAYFDGSQINKINGVVTDADEYDWALPQDTTYFGGILIWHIDESVIDQNLSTNTINANPAHRGVSLMEAHGANEIGNYIQSIFGAYYYDGSPYDFWYGGNPMRATPRKTGGNNFNPTTLPSSNGYNGANSHIYISNFSGHDSLMTFDVRVGESNFQPTPGFPKDIHSATTNSSPVFGHLTPDGKMQLVANNGSSLYAFNLDGTSAGFDSTGFFSKVGGRFQPVVSSSGASDTLYAMDDSVFYGLIDRDNNHDGTADTIFAAKDTLFTGQAGTPLLFTGKKIVVINSQNLSWSLFTSDGKFVGTYHLIQVQNSTTSFSSVSPTLSQFAAVDTSELYLLVGGNVIHVNSNNLVSTSSTPILPHPGYKPPPTPIAICYAALSPDKGNCLIEISQQSVSIDTAGFYSSGSFNLLPGDTITSGPVIADLNGDGSRDIIFATQTKVYAISYTGAVLNHFPISTVGSEILPSDANRIVGSMVVAKLTGDTADVIFGTKGGTLYAFNGVTGQMLNGFPISTGGGLAGSPAITYDSQSGNLYLAAIGLDGYLYSWTFKGNYSASSILWGNLLHNNSHTNSVTTALPAATIPPSITDTVSLMPKVYNWPNPVTTGTTKIRFYLRDNAQVSISIYSFAGQKVADMQANGLGGTANEVDWNVAGVQSGVYFARVEAVSSKTNQRSVAIIKIAVVK